jgi:Uma2 family endonuclease
MTAFPAERRHVFSFEEYAAIADKSSVRVEFWDGVILDMSGGSPRHSAICSNIVRILGGQLRGAPCRIFDANLRVRSVAARRSTYADATVVCGPLQLDPSDVSRQTVLNPTLLVEVQSPSTSGDDRGPKLDSYKLISSVRAVVLVAQDDQRVTLHSRRADGSWQESEHLSGVIELEAIACQLPLAEIYEDLPPA